MVMEQFDSMLSPVIDSTLDQRAKGQVHEPPSLGLTNLPPSPIYRMKNRSRYSRINGTCPCDPFAYVNCGLIEPIPMAASTFYGFFDILSFFCRTLAR